MDSIDTKMSRNIERLQKKCLKLRLIEEVDDEVFIDILKTLKFLEITLKKLAPDIIEDALEFSQGINLVMEKSSEELIIKYFPDLIEAFLLIITTTNITGRNKLMEFLHVIHDLGVNVPDETKRFTFIEQEHLFKQFIEFIRDHANYKTQVLGMHIFVTYFCLFDDSERVKIGDNLFPENFEQSKFCLWYLEKIDFDLNCRLFLNSLNEENLSNNNICNVFSLKAESIRIGDKNLIPPMEGDEIKLELWVDYNFSDETITFFCDGKSFKNSGCAWPLLVVSAANILDVEFKNYDDDDDTHLTIYLKYPILTADSSVLHTVQIYKSICFEFKSNQNLNYFCEKIWPTFLQRILSYSPTREQNPTFLETLIPSVFKENSPEPMPEPKEIENEFKIPSVENIPKTSLKRRYMKNLDLNKDEPTAKRVNLVKPIQMVPGPSNIKKRKYTTKAKKLTINFKESVEPRFKPLFSRKSIKPVDVYDINLEFNQETMKKSQLTVNPSIYLPHTDFHSPVKLTANKNASFSYRAAAIQSKYQNIDAQHISIQNEKMLEADLEADSSISVVDNILGKTEGDENISIEETVIFKTPKITLKNKRFKKYSPL